LFLKGREENGYFHAQSGRGRGGKALRQFQKKALLPLHLRRTTQKKKEIKEGKGVGGQYILSRAGRRVRERGTVNS